MDVNVVVGAMHYFWQDGVSLYGVILYMTDMRVDWRGACLGFNVSYG